MANPIVQQINAELAELQNQLAKFKDTVDYLNGAKTAVKNAVIKVNYSEAHFNKKVEELKATYDSFIKLNDTVTKVVSKIDTINFPERLDSIEKNVSDTINHLNTTRKITLDELQKASLAIRNTNFDTYFKTIEKSINSSSVINQELVTVIEKQKLPQKINGLEQSINNMFESSFLELKRNNKQFVSEISKIILDLDFQSRLNKVDALIAGVLTESQKINKSIDIINHDFNDKIKEVHNENMTTLFSFREKLNHDIIFLQAKIKIIEDIQQRNSYITWVLIIATLVVLLISK